ncbi:MAG: insulinase family protein [Bacteroidota bacterium]|jgi:predicted Zn-dependent peptidase|nr:MAG: peptidase M16 [Bacteroidota bacterium]
MKAYIRKTFILLFAATLTAPCLYGQVDRTKAPEPGPAREIEIGEYQTFTLKNGLQVFVVENHKLPRVQFSLQLRHDPVYEGEKAGYVSMAGDLIGTGTTNRSKAQLDEEIDFIGASLNTSANGIYASSLTKHMPKLLELFTDVLYNPSFNPEELEKIRTQTRSAIVANKEDPEVIASNVRSALLYGKDHPYGDLVTEETIDAITLEDCKAYYQTYFKPNNAYLAIVGDIDLKTAKKLVKKHFGKWESGTVPAPVYPTPQLPEKTFVAMVDRSSAVQSVITVAHPVELKPGSPDAIKAGVMNNILGGGGLSSRLNQNLREHKGFTYGAYSSLSSDKLIGSFDAEVSVRNEVTDSAVVELLRELRRIREEPVDEAELKAAKAYISGSFGRSLENPATIANFAINIAKYNLPEDYYDNYVKNVAAVTPEDVQTVAKKLIHPDRAYIILVGKASDVAPGLKRFGELKYFDIYGNPYTPSEKAEIPPGLTAEKVIENYIQAVGGEANIDAIKSFVNHSEASVQGTPIQIVTFFSAPNKTSMEISAGGQLIQKVTCDGKDVSISYMGNTVPLDDASKERVLFDSYLVGERRLKEAGVSVALTGVEQIDGRNAYVVEYTFPLGSKSTVYFDTETGLKVRMVVANNTPMGEVTQTTTYSDYVEKAGVKFPLTVVQNAGPQTLTVKSTSVELNAPVPEEKFVIK